MSGLKTIKDLEEEFLKKYTAEDTIVDPDRIRDEAIKYLNLDYLTIGNYPTEEGSDVFNKKELKAMDWFIKHFFNLKEEDLK